MIERTTVALIAVGTLALAGGLWWQYGGRAPATGTIERTPPTPPAEATGEPAAGAIEHPIAPVSEPAEPLPPLAESDAFLGEALADLSTGGADAPSWSGEQLARRFVATVDALPRGGVPIETRAIRAVPGQLVVEGPEDAPVLSPRNGERYEAHVRWLESVDAAQAAATYRRVYPLLQGAYESLGYPDRYFNDRVVAVVDHLLATPEVQGPVRLARPHVLYTYADPALENRSAGQKTLLRMGPERARRVKAWLAKLRTHLVAGESPPSSATGAPTS